MYIPVLQLLEIPFKYHKTTVDAMLIPFSNKLLFHPLSSIRAASPLSFKHPLGCLWVHGYQWTTCWVSNSLTSGAHLWPRALL